MKKLLITILFFTVISCNAYAWQDGAWGTGSGTSGTPVTLSADAEEAGLSITDQEIDLKLATTSQSGSMSYTDKENLDQLVTNEAAAEAISPTTSGLDAGITATLISPASIYAVTPTIPLKLATLTDITISRIRVNLSEDPTNEPTITFNYRSAGAGFGSPYTPIQVVTTTAGTADYTMSVAVPSGMQIDATFSAEPDAYSTTIMQIEATND